MKEMEVLKGGFNPNCCCGCLYANNGGSSISANDSANDKGGGLHSPGCVVVVITNSK